MFNNKNIFISGGTGSFGNKFIEIVVKKYKPKKDTQIFEQILRKK